jgi:hypothetical protein
MNREGTICTEDLVQKAVRTIREKIEGNRELYLAQIIKMNPDINLLDYSLCYMPCYEQDGKHYDRMWLEKIDKLDR